MAVADDANTCINALRIGQPDRVGCNSELEELDKKLKALLLPMRIPGLPNYVTDIIYQLEQGAETGMLHWQCAFRAVRKDKSGVENAVSAKQLNESLQRFFGPGAFHLSAARKDDDLKRYAAKVADPSRLAGPWRLPFDSKWADEKEAVDPKMTTVDFVRKTRENGGSLSWMMNDDEALAFYARNHNGLSKVAAMLTAPRSYGTMADTTTNIVHYGEHGSGKTEYAMKVLAALAGGLYVKSGSHWFYNYANEKNIIIDEFEGSMNRDPDALKLTDLNTLMGRNAFIADTKGGHASILATTIVITSNSPPWRWYPQEFTREFRKGSLMRRIAKLYKWRRSATYDNFVEIVDWEKEEACEGAGEAGAVDSAVPMVVDGSGGTRKRRRDPDE
jgi:hypothetical protein